MKNGVLDKAFDALMSDLARQSPSERSKVPARLVSLCEQSRAPDELRALVASSAHLIARGGAAALLQQAASLGLSSPLGDVALQWAAKRWPAPLLLSVSPPAQPQGASAKARPLELGPAEQLLSAPDGKHVLVVGLGSAALWDTSTGACRAELGAAQRAAMFPSGSDALLASGADLTRVSLPLGKQRWQVVSCGDVRALSVRADGLQIALATVDGLIELRDARTGRRTALLEGHSGRVLGLALSPDSHMLASLSSDGVVRLWDAARGIVEEKIELERWRPDRSAQLAFSPDGAHLWILSPHDGFGVWDIAHRERVVALALGYDDRASLDERSGRLLTLASGLAGRGDDKLELRHVDEAQSATLRLPRPSGIEVLCVMSGTSAIVAVDRAGNGALYDLAVGVEREPSVASAHSGSVDALAFDASSSRLVSVARRASAQQAETFELRLWHASHGALDHEVSGITPAVDDVLLALEGALALTWSRLDSVLNLWGLRRGTRKHTKLLGHEAQVLDVALLSCGKRFVSASRDGTLRLWDLTTREPLLTLGAGHGSIERLAPHPDGRLIAESGRGDRDDGELRLWDLDQGALVARLPLYAERIGALTFSSSGALLAGTSDGRIAVFNIDAGTCMFELDAHPGSPVVWVGFAGRSLVPLSADVRTLRVWDVTTGQPRCEFALEGKAFRIDPSGRLLALHGTMTSSPRALELFDLLTGAPLATWQTDAPIHCVALGADGLIAAGDQRGRLHHLRLHPSGSDALRHLDETPATHSAVRERRRSATATTAVRARASRQK